MLSPLEVSELYEITEQTLKHVMTDIYSLPLDDETQWFIQNHLAEVRVKLSEAIKLEIVNGEFVNMALNKKKLEESKKTAGEVIQRNKRLGDLLAGKEHDS